MRKTMRRFGDEAFWWLVIATMIAFWLLLAVLSWSPSATYRRFIARCDDAVNWCAQPFICGLCWLNSRPLWVESEETD